MKKRALLHRFEQILRAGLGIAAALRQTLDVRFTLRRLPCRSASSALLRAMVMIQAMAVPRPASAGRLPPDLPNRVLGDFFRQSNLAGDAQGQSIDPCPPWFP